MRLTHIKAENWMAYEELDLDLADVAQVAITGHNNHGKSALLDAVEWCLWGRIGRDIDQRSSDKFIRRGTDLMSVTVEFWSQGRLVEVTREKPAGKTSTLSLVVDGVSQRGHVIGRKGDDEGTLDETQSRIDALIGLGYDAIAAGPFMAQEQASYFMKASPRDRKDLLIRLLGVDAYEPLAKAAAGEAARHSALAEMAAINVGRLQEVVDGETKHDEALSWARANLEAARLAERDATRLVETTQLHYAELKGQADLREVAVGRVRRAESALAAARQSVVSERAQLDDFKTRAAEPEPAVTVPLPLEPHVIEEAAAALREVNARHAQYADVREQSARLRHEVLNAGRARAIATQVPCGAVGEYAACQFLRDVPSEEEFAAAQDALQLAETALIAVGQPDVATAQNAYNEALREANERQRAIREAGHQRELWQARRDNAQQMVALAATRLQAALEREGEAAVEYEQATQAMAAFGEPPELAGIASQLEWARGERDRWAREREAREDALRPLEAEAAVIAHAKAELEVARAAMTESEGLAAGYSVLAKAWHRDGIPTSLIEAAVPTIESKANAVLEGMPEDLAVQLRTQRPTKTGGMAETLDAVVTIDGWESDYALLSVGARFRVDIALRLALSDMLTNRSGATIETLWLDEPLAALDADGREAAVETLSGLAEDFGLIVVVSHHEDMNDRFPARIRVTKEDGVSRAVLET